MYKNCTLYFIKNNIHNNQENMNIMFKNALNINNIFNYIYYKVARKNKKI